MSCATDLVVSPWTQDVGDSATRLLDPSRMLSEYGPRGLAFVIDGGMRPAEVSTVIDLTKGDPIMIRAGKGDPTLWSSLNDTEADEALVDAYVQPVFPTST
jgi:hypothetical protein